MYLTGVTSLLVGLAGNKMLNLTDNTNIHTLVLWSEYYMLYDAHCVSICVETNQNILIKTCALQKQLRIVFYRKEVHSESSFFF